MKRRKACVLLITIVFLWCLMILFVIRNFTDMRRTANENGCKGGFYFIASSVENSLELNHQFPFFSNDNNEITWSWRAWVLLLGGSSIKTNEFWNSEYNTTYIKQHSLDGSYFTCPSCSKKHASYVAVTGPGTLWTETNRGRVKDPYKYGDMILIIETTEPKNYWAEPGDDASPEDVIRMFQADPGLVKNSKQSMFSTEHWPKYFITLNNRCCSFAEIKDVEELKRRLVIPEEELLPLQDEKKE